MVLDGFNIDSSIIQEIYLPQSYGIQGLIAKDVLIYVLLNSYLPSMVLILHKPKDHSIYFTMVFFKPTTPPKLHPLPIDHSSWPPLVATAPSCDPPVITNATIHPPSTTIIPTTDIHDDLWR